MGAMKDCQLQQREEEMGVPSLQWAQVKCALEWLIHEFSPDAADFEVQDAIEDRKGVAACGVDWSGIRLMRNNLGELYFSDLDLADLYGQIAHMCDRFGRLADKVEQAREDAEFCEALERD